MNPEPDYVLVLRPLKGPWRAPGIQRIKALLKLAKRGLGLQAIRVSEQRVEQAQAKGEAKP